MKKVVTEPHSIPKEFEMTKEKYNYIKKNQQLYTQDFLGYIGHNFSYAGSYFQGYIQEKKKNEYSKRAYNTAQRDSKALQGVKFFNLDYEKVKIPPKSIVYCDIPYKDTTGYNVDFDYKRFFRYVKKLKKQGHYVFISEYSKEMPEGLKEVGQYRRKSNMRNGALAKKGRKLGKKEKFK